MRVASCLRILSRHETAVVEFDQSQAAVKAATAGTVDETLRIKVDDKNM